MKPKPTQPCHRCKGINFDEIFSRTDLESRAEGVPLVDIDYLSRNCRRATCDICRFLAFSTSLVDKAVVADTWHLRAYDYSTLRFGDTAEGEISSGDLTLTLAPGSIHDEWSGDIDMVASHCILPTHGRPPAQRFRGYQGRRIGRSIDFARVRQWIDTCAKEHTKCVQKAGASAPLDLHVIDCDTCEVVPCRGAEYVALSYCIGPKTVRGSNSRPSKGIRRFPKVIADAVRCCRGLGYKYLWVDQVCIDQDDQTALANAISAMHQIYSSSVLTIVSLGMTQNDGLAGISGMARTHQASLRTDHATYVSTMTSLPLAIRASKWMTRGWCYQEAVLSRRLLFVGSDQTYYMCSTSEHQESLCEALSFSNNATDERETLVMPHSTALHKGWADNGVWSFGGWIEAYTTRDLSFQSDILNAFRGVLNISAHLTYWGIPLVTSCDNPTNSNPARAFAVGLGWATTYNQDPQIHEWYENNIPTDNEFYKRQDFPSWSWAACKTFRSPIAYKVPEDFSYESKSDIDQNTDDIGISIALEDDAGKMVPIDIAVKLRGNGTKSLQEKSRYINIDTETISVQLTGIRSDRSLFDDSGFAKFCIRVPGDPHLNTDITVVPQSAIRSGAFVTPEDGRFFVDFDRPPTVRDQFCERVHQQTYLGLVLFYRSEEIAKDRDKNSIDEFEEDDDLGGSHCILLCLPCSSESCHERIGLVWIDDEHMSYFKRERQKVRLR